MRPDVAEYIVARARDVGLPVSAHVSTTADFATAVRIGVDEIAHIPLFGEPDPATIRDAAAAGIRIVTTLAGPPGNPSSSQPATRARARRWLSAIRDAQATLVIGSDIEQSTSRSEALDIWNLGVYDSGTLLGAWARAAQPVVPDRRVGRLEEGYEASFLVLEDNPLEHFETVRFVRMRIKRGVLISVN